MFYVCIGPSKKTIFKKQLAGACDIKTIQNVNFQHNFITLVHIFYFRLCVYEIVLSWPEFPFDNTDKL